MRLIQTEKNWQIVFYLEDVILKGQCENLYDCPLIRHIQLSYKGKPVIDDLVDKVRIYVSPNISPQHLAHILQYARRVLLYHPE
jgi:hypothetical protein